MSKNAAKTGDCKNASGKIKRISSSNHVMKALEKIGLKKGPRKKSIENATPIARVFHEYLRIYSIEEMFV
jgi:hypothetical protein